jgi:hypothetical protein
MVMATVADEKAMNLYKSLMEEAKIRALSINTIGHAALLPYPLVREYAYLQLRMLCELIALGCLAAHGDITQTKYFQREAYKADEILKRLEGLHQQFYPVPVWPKFSPGHVHLEAHPPGFDFLSKDDLLQLYGKCGDVLHKGRLPRIILPPVQSNDQQEVQRWGQKILNLLSSHRITRLGGNLHFLILLEVKSAGGNVQVAIAESPKP